MHPAFSIAGQIYFALVWGMYCSRVSFDLCFFRRRVGSTLSAVNMCKQHNRYLGVVAYKVWTKTPIGLIAA